MALEGGMRIIKYLLFVFNLLFMLAGLALVIIGAVAAAKLAPYSSVANVHFNGVGVFLIVIGLVIFFISFFGCLGAYKESYCLLVIFCILMVISFLALIAALIAAFVMRNQVRTLIDDGLRTTIPEYNVNDTKFWATELWDNMQKDWECCGSNETRDWNLNKELSKTNSVPRSCCRKQFDSCAKNQTLHPNATYIYTQGCSDKLNDLIYGNMILVGGAAAAIAILQFIGIIFAGCLLRGLRKEYSTV